MTATGKALAAEGTGMHRVLAPSDVSFSDAGLSADDARLVYRELVRARRFDDRARTLQRRGWLNAYSPLRGRETSQVGAAYAMADADWLFPTPQSTALQLAFGVSMVDLLAVHRGHGEFHADRDHNVFPQAAPFAAQLPHAVGAGMARNHRENDHAVVASLGGDATHAGDFHEAMNFAGVFDAPVVFFCETDARASTPRERGTAAETVAETATAYGFDGVRVDGSDPFAVYETLRDALGTARGGEPVLVESITTRRPASPAEAADREREKPIEPPNERGGGGDDPLARVHDALTDADVIDPDYVDSLEEEADADLDAAVDAVEALDPPTADDLFAHVYATSTPRLDEQRERLRGVLDRHPDADPARQD